MDRDAVELDVEVPASARKCGVVGRFEIDGHQGEDRPQEGCCQLNQVDALLARSNRAPTSCSRGARHHLPLDERSASEQAVVSRSKEVAADPEEVVDHAVDGRKVLQLSGRFEAAHLPLALSDRLVRHFGFVVRIAVCAVRYRWHH